MAEKLFSGSVYLRETKAEDPVLQLQANMGGEPPKGRTRLGGMGGSDENNDIPDAFRNAFANSNQYEQSIHRPTRGVVAVLERPEPVKPLTIREYLGAVLPYQPVDITIWNLIKKGWQTLRR